MRLVWKAAGALFALAVKTAAVFVLVVGFVAVAADVPHGAVQLAIILLTLGAAAFGFGYMAGEGGE